MSLQLANNYHFLEPARMLFLISYHLHNFIFLISMFSPHFTSLTWKPLLQKMVSQLNENCGNLAPYNYSHVSFANCLFYICFSHVSNCFSRPCFVLLVRSVSSLRQREFLVGAKYFIHTILF